jgi:hypothetical protein
MQQQACIVYMQRQAVNQEMRQQADAASCISVGTQASAGSTDHHIWHSLQGCCHGHLKVGKGDGRIWLLLRLLLRLGGVCRRRRGVHAQNTVSCGTATVRCRGAGL